MGYGKRRYYYLLLAVMFVMFCCSPIGCSCSKKKKDDAPGVGAVTVNPGPQNGSTGGLITGGDTNVVMLQFTVANGTAFATINWVRVKASGSGDDATDVSAVRLYHDTDSDAQYDPGTDIPLAGPSTYSEDDGTITFTVNRDLNPNTSENWIVLYDFVVGATGTFVCSIDDVASDIYTTVGGKWNIPQPGGPSTITGGTATAQPNTLTVAEGPNNPPDSTIAGGQSDVPMLQFSLTAGPGSDVTWTGITFSASGTGDESTDVTLAQLWNDTNNDGSPDTEIDAGTTYAAENGTISWTSLTETIATSSTKYFVLTYDFAADVNGTFHVEITDVTTDVTAQVGVTTIIASGTSPVSGPTITVDSTPPYVVRAMFEGLDPLVPAAGDTIKVYFSEEITATGVAGTHWNLPNTANPPGDNFGGGATFVQDGNTAVLITLAAGTTFIIPGTFDPDSPADGPSGIDVAASITSITDTIGNNAVPRDDTAVSALTGETAPGVDIKSKFIPDGNPVDGLEANVLTPTGEQSGDGDGYVMIQYFVAATDSISTVNLSVEFDDGTGYASATEGTQIFTTPFNPSATGDLKIYVWDAHANFPAADNDPVSLRFTFDPNTPGDPNDDMVDEISFTLDNKPQAVVTRPFVTPARKRLFIYMNDSWDPSGTVLPSDAHAVTFDSVPGGSALTDSDIIVPTPLFAVFQPDVAGDYVLNVTITAGAVVSDVVVTTIHALDPDNFVGANEAETYDMSGLGGAADEPVMPGYLAYDETGKHLVYTADNDTCFVRDMGEYVLIRQLLCRFDTTSLPAATAATSPITGYITYATHLGEWCLPYYVSSYYNGASIGTSYYHRTLFGGGTPTIYNLGLADGNDTCFKNVIGFTTDWIEWEQADLSADDNPPIGGPAEDWVMGGRLAQVVRGTSDLTYWLVDQQWLDTGTGILYPVRSHLVECSGFENDSSGARIAGTLHWHDGVALPLCETVTPYLGLAYDVVVQLLVGTPTAWVTIPQGPTPGVYYVDLSAGVGNMGTPTAVAAYTGETPATMALDETNGYLYVSNLGETSAAAGMYVNGSITVIDLTTRTVVAEINLPGDYIMEELAFNDIDNLLYGTDSARDMVHVVHADYSGATPVLTSVPSIDTSRHARDIVWEDTRNVLFVSENANNSILTTRESVEPGWVFDHDAGAAVNTVADEQNADWAVDPVSGDLCMVFQRDTNSGIYFTRSADGGQTWSAPVQVDDGSGISATQDPDVAVDPWGTLVVVWAADSAGAGDYDIFLARSDDDGATWDGPFKVNTDTGANPQGDPCVEVDFLGNILVAFESSDGTNVAIEMVKTVGHQRWTYSGPDDSNIAVSTAGAYDCADPDIALAPRTSYLPDAWVTWSDDRTATLAVMVNYTDNSTTFGADMASGMTFTFGTETAVNDDNTSAAINARCVWDPVATVPALVVVWEQDLGNGAGIYVDEGNTAGFGTDVVVEEPADATSGTRNNPYLAINQSSGYRVVAYESDLKGDKDAFWEIIRFNYAGWDGEGMRMNADATTTAQTRPLVHIGMGNNCFVTWEDERGGVSKDLYSKRQ